MRGRGNVGRSRFSRKFSYKYAVKGNPSPGEIGCDQNEHEYLNDLSTFFKLAFQKLKQGKFLYININKERRNCETQDLSFLIIELARNSGFIHRDTIIWIKENTRPVPPGSKPYYLDDGWEYILVFCIGKAQIIRENYLKPSVNFRCDFCGELNHIDRKVKPNYVSTNIGFTESTYLESSHPAKFPKAIPRFVFSLSTQPGDTILDPFCGVGTSLVAGLELGLNVIGIELISHNYQMAINEIEKLE
jgi:DNA modification methylase